MNEKLKKFLNEFLKEMLAFCILFLIPFAAFSTVLYTDSLWDMVVSDPSKRMFMAFMGTVVLLWMVIVIVSIDEFHSIYVKKRVKE